MSYGATQRTREIGIRMALGATPQAVLKMILQQGVWMIMLGMAVGLMGAAGVTRILVRFLFSISFADPLDLFRGCNSARLSSLWASLHTRPPGHAGGVGMAALRQ